MKSCRQIVTSVLFFRFLTNLGQIRKPDSSSIVCKTYIFINSNLLSKNAHISKIKRVLVLKVYFLKLCMHVYSRTKFQKKLQNTSTPKNGSLKSLPRLKLNRLSKKLLILLFLFAVLLFPFPVLLYL